MVSVPEQISMDSFVIIWFGEGSHFFNPLKICPSLSKEHNRNIDCVANLSKGILLIFEIRKGFEFCGCLDMIGSFSLVQSVEGRT